MIHEQREELASLYVLDLLKDQDLRRFEQELTDDTSLQQLVRDLREGLSALSLNLPAKSPPAGLKHAILRRIKSGDSSRDNSEEPAALAAGVTHVVSRFAWKPSGIPGVDVCRLRGSLESKSGAAYYKIGPGRSLPPHKHVGSEDCLVIKGSACDENGIYTAGMYVHNAPGTDHHELRAMDDGDCIVFIVYDGIEPLTNANLSSK